MTKQTFTTGQVLTAAQMTSLQQTAMGGGSTTAKTASYVLVAADAGTVVQMNAAGATTITVNTALFAAGDSVQIQNVGAGVCTVTAGTATVSTAGSLALSQYEGGQLYFNTTSAALFFDVVQGAGMTNPMTTTGDIIYSSSGSTPARLGIGTTGQVVTVASGLPSWATPASGGGMTLLSTTTLSGTSTVINVAAGYINLFVVISGVTTSADYELAYRVNNIGGTGYYMNGQRSYNTTSVAGPADTFVVFAPGSTAALAASANNIFTAIIENYDSNTKYKTFSNNAGITNNVSVLYQMNSQCVLFDTTAMTSLKIMTTTGTPTFSTGTVLIYGVK